MGEVVMVFRGGRDPTQAADTFPVRKTFERAEDRTPVNLKCLCRSSPCFCSGTVTRIAWSRSRASASRLKGSHSGEHKKKNKKKKKKKQKIKKKKTKKTKKTKKNKKKIKKIKIKIKLKIY